MGWWTKLKNWATGTAQDTEDIVEDYAPDIPDLPDLPDPEDYLPDWNKLIFYAIISILAIVLVAWVLLSG